MAKRKLIANPPPTPEELEAQKARAARRAWARVTNGIPRDAFEAELNKFMVLHAPKGARFHGSFERTEDDGFFGSWHVALDLSFSVSCDIYVRRSSPDWDSRVINPENAKEQAWLVNYEVSIGWSSVGRSVAQAAACVALYTECVGYAAKVQAFCDRHIWYGEEI